jgi:outer membrane protein OmpA-like peptidoglycan-associated protein
MLFQNDDSAKRLTLSRVFGLGVLLAATAIALGFYKRESLAQPARPDRSEIPAVGNFAIPAARINTAQAASDSASVFVEQGVVKFYFAPGKADLASGAGNALANMVKAAQGGRKLVISGFHDATGKAAQNNQLANKRALAVHAVLMQAGVAQSQIDVKKLEPASEAGSSAEARRVEISLQ